MISIRFKNNCNSTIEDDVHGATLEFGSQLNKSQVDS